MCVHICCCFSERKLEQSIAATLLHSFCYPLLPIPKSFQFKCKIYQPPTKRTDTNFKANVLQLGCVDVSMSIASIVWKTVNLHNCTRISAVFFSFITYFHFLVTLILFPFSFNSSILHHIWPHLFLSRRNFSYRTSVLLHMLCFASLSSLVPVLHYTVL